MAGKGGGAWKVAYADFVTAMMAFFLVMWITAQNKAVKVAVARYFNDPFNSKSKSHGPLPAGSATGGPLAPGSAYLMPSRTPGDAPGVVKRPSSPRAALRIIADPIAKVAGSGGRKDYDGEKPMVFLLHNNDNHAGGVVIVFSDTAGQLSPEAMRQLKNVIPALLGKRNKIEVRGHAPQAAPQAGSPSSDPWQLSYTRCLATMAFLEQEGVEPERIRLSQAGPFEPHRARDDPEDLSRNSFVDVYMLGEFVDDFMHPREEKFSRPQAIRD
ncbi:MAG: flagellar motor protein MotB [Thermoguttaceae bacterium]